MPRNYPVVALVLLTFFVISFITNVFGPIFPALVADFRISLGLAGFFPFAFFAAYACMSIPAGMLVHRHGEKRVMMAAFALAGAGSVLFALMPTFALAMVSLFLIGAGMALLQVAINPLLRVAGGEAQFAFFSVLAQLLFGAAAALSPLVYSALVGAAAGRAVPTGLIAVLLPQQMPWLSLYWLFALLSAAMLLVLLVLRLPVVARMTAEQVGAWRVHAALLRDRTVRVYFGAIVAYVGTEQGVANSIAVFLQRYHGLDPVSVGATVVSTFWIAMSAGCLLGLLLLKLFDSRHVLIAFSGGAIAALATALLGDSATATQAFAWIGFFLSVMFSVIFSLALNSLREHHGAFSGILCSGIVGGAIASPLIGFVADGSGSLRVGMSVLFGSLGYILAIGFWARPLIANDTLLRRRATTGDGVVITMPGHR